MAGAVRKDIKNWQGRAQAALKVLQDHERVDAQRIAAIVDRPPEQVRQSIHNAREALRHALPVENPLKDKLLQHTTTS